MLKLTFGSFFYDTPKNIKRQTEESEADLTLQNKSASFRDRTANKSQKFLT